jgi:uncharacterized protein YutD
MRLDHKFWEFAEKQEDFISAFDTWISYWEGCVLCHCDHGCNQFILENAAKMAAILRARNSYSYLMDELNDMAKRDESEFRTELWKENYRKASERNNAERAKNETKS